MINILRAAVGAVPYTLVLPTSCQQCKVQKMIDVLLNNVKQLFIRLLTKVFFMLFRKFKMSLLLLKGFCQQLNSMTNVN